MRRLFYESIFLSFGTYLVGFFCSFGAGGASRVYPQQVNLRNGRARKRVAGHSTMNPATPSKLARLFGSSTVAVGVSPCSLPSPKCPIVTGVFERVRYEGLVQVVPLNTCGVGVVWKIVAAGDITRRRTPPPTRALGCLRGGHTSGGEASHPDVEKLEHTGIVVAQAAAASKANPNFRLWLDVVETFLSAISISLEGWRPVFHFLRGMFGLSLLFYGSTFSTLAFHIMVFRISGWKKAVKHANELWEHYRKVRAAMGRATRDIRATSHVIASKDRLMARKQGMMLDKKRLLKAGRVTPEEARAFIDKYRNEIENIAQEQEAIATASSSILAIKASVSVKKIMASLNSLYAAVITSITASSFKRAGQLTLALTCGGLLKGTLFDLLGPLIDPIGYQIELETYVAKIMRGPANTYITLVGYLASMGLFFHFYVDPNKTLRVAMIFLGAHVVKEYVLWAVYPLRRALGMKKTNQTPLAGVVHISLSILGFLLHGEAGIVGAVCRPYISFLQHLNTLLNKFQISTISYFS